MKNTKHVMSGMVVRDQLIARWPEDVRLQYQEGVWQTSKMPFAVSGCSAVAVGDNVYLFGGAEPKPGTCAADHGDSSQLCGYSGYNRGAEPTWRLGPGCVYCHASSERVQLRCFNVKTGEWTQGVGPPTRRLQCAAVLVGSHIYTIGGYSSKHPAQLCNCQTSSWAPNHNRPLPATRDEFCCRQSKTVFAVVGTVERLDVRSGQWERCRPMPTKRAGCAAVVSGKYVYVLGGYSGTSTLHKSSSVHNGSGENLEQYIEGFAPEVLSTVERLDTASGEWETLPCMGCPRANCNAAAYGGYIYAIGGESHTINNRGCITRTASTPVASAERMNVDAGTWGRLSDTPPALPGFVRYDVRAGGGRHLRRRASAVMGRCLFLIGGDGGEYTLNGFYPSLGGGPPQVQGCEFSNAVQCLDLETCRWTNCTGLGPPYAKAPWGELYGRAAAAAVAVGETLYVFGGMSRKLFDEEGHRERERREYHTGSDDARFNRHRERQRGLCGPRSYLDTAEQIRVQASPSFTSTAVNTSPVDLSTSASNTDTNALSLTTTTSDGTTNTDTDTSDIGRSSSSAPGLAEHGALQDLRAVAREVLEQRSDVRIHASALRDFLRTQNMEAVALLIDTLNREAELRSNGATAGSPIRASFTAFVTEGEAAIEQHRHAVAAANATLRAGPNSGEGREGGEGGEGGEGEGGEGGGGREEGTSEWLRVWMRTRDEARRQLRSTLQNRLARWEEALEELERASALPALDRARAVAVDAANQIACVLEQQRGPLGGGSSNGVGDCGENPAVEKDSGANHEQPSDEYLRWQRVCTQAVGQWCKLHCPQPHAARSDGALMDLARAWGAVHSSMAPTGDSGALERFVATGDHHSILQTALTAAREALEEERAFWEMQDSAVSAESLGGAAQDPTDRTDPGGAGGHVFSWSPSAVAAFPLAELCSAAVAVAEAFAREAGELEWAQGLVEAARAELRQLEALPGSTPGLEEVEAGRRAADEAGKAFRRARRSLEAGQDEEEPAETIAALEAEVKRCQAAYQHAQRELEARRHALFVAATQHFPEMLRLYEGVIVPYLGLWQWEGRKYEMYTPIEWPRGLQPPRSLHLVRPYLFDGTRCVLKEHRLGSASDERRFQRESGALGDLQHPCIVPVLACFLDGGGARPLRGYLHMPLYPGGNAQAWLRRRENWVEPAEGGLLDRRDERVALGPVRVLRCALEGLLYLHARFPAPAVHGDLKLENVLVDDQGNAALSDFELSRMWARDDPGGGGEATFVTTRAGSGTPGYMAPEVCLGARPSPASDMYSFGVCMLLVMMPDCPLDDLAKMGTAAAAASGGDAVASALEVPQVCWDRDPELAALIAKCLHQCPGERPAATQVVSDPVFSVGSLLQAAGSARRALRDAQDRLRANLHLAQQHRSDLQDCRDKLHAVLSGVWSSAKLPESL